MKLKSAHLMRYEAWECFIEEIITAQLLVVFDAGCRSTKACRANSLTKRAESGGLIACSHCCNTPKMANTHECNSNLCGLEAMDNQSTQCYYCGHWADARQGVVTDPLQCVKKKLCGDDEICSVTTKNIGGVTKYEFGCKQLLECQTHTIASLELQGVHTGIDIVQLAGAGTLQVIGRKRQINNCDICCGDDYCNDASCESVRRRLVTFANANRLNYTSLKVIQ
ncbi:hypothetical protein CHS0354_036061 [Potamilus streckersoni]|uniref:Uncharacterized protein n=1 Tax=Potamilus streckersoni TaxID=2493646 RepID=A0AAE0TAZ6_9BIVA|nr:hypothetical protein CHS0354_036061 [Potamilus streckersoni]